MIPKRPGDTVEYGGVPLRVVEAFQVYRTMDGTPYQLIYCAAANASSKRLVVLEQRPTGLRKIESQIRQFRSVQELRA